MGDCRDEDILNPPIVVIGQCHYRVNAVHPYFLKEYPGLNQESGYQEDDLYADDDEDESYDIQVEGSTFKTTFHVPRVFYGSLIGQKGLAKKRLESETKTEVIIPGHNATKDSMIIIKGKSRKNVCAARRRLDLTVANLRRRTSPTHFVCVPANVADVKKSFNNLRESILLENYPGIDDTLFIAAEKIHLTIVMCVLLDDEERVRAGQIFMDCKEILTKMPPIEVQIRGLEIMNDDPSAVAVLYAGVQSSDLQILADMIAQKFKEAGLSCEEKGHTVKLHMTVMNARYRREMDPASLETFDARKILYNYGEYEFGKFRLTEIHLSQRHTTSENGFYRASGIINV